MLGMNTQEQISSIVNKALFIYDYHLGRRA